MAWSTQLGARGEAVAQRYLRRRGLTVVCSNYRIPGGEIDVVCLDGETLVFVEVKTSSRSAESGLLAVTEHKRRRLERAAERFLADQPPDAFVSTRFDVIVVYFSRPGQASVYHLRDAIQADDYRLD